MRICFYKLPSEAGENIIVTDTFVFLDSEIAIELEEADLALDYYDIFVDTENRQIERVDDDPENIDPYFVLGWVNAKESTYTLDATLPFASQEDAEGFVDTIFKWQEIVDKAHDE